MAYKYLYIDDLNKDDAEGTIAGLQKKGELEILFVNPSESWNQQIEFITEKEKEIDGLILDLRLQDNPIENTNVHAKYRGSSLAQELRTLSKENTLKDFPIILLSATDQVDKSLDSTGMDLFDLKVIKEKLKESAYSHLRSQLISLAFAYKEASKFDVARVSETISLLLGISADKKIDTRLVENLTNIISNGKPIHELIGFLLKQIIMRPGILIDELYLAARLGVDRIKSSDWGKLLGKLAEAKYKGFLGDHWQRWWASDLESWWYNNVCKDTSLNKLSASNRVSNLKKELDLENLVPSIKLSKASSEFFWVVCQGLKEPIDIVDGFKIAGSDNIYPWQEYEYISIDEVLDRENVEIWKEIASLEKPRLEQMQKLYARDRSKG